MRDRLKELAKTPQPHPVNDSNAVSLHDLVAADLEGVSSTGQAVIQARKDLGLEKYGVILSPGNGRSYLADALQEAGDLPCYLKGCAIKDPRFQASYERSLQLLAELADLADTLLE